MDISKYTFEDSSVSAFFYKAHCITLQLEGVALPNGEKTNIKLNFANVSQILIDDKPYPTIRMLYNDGAIIHLEKEENGTLIIIEWTDYKNNLSKTLSYDIDSSNVNLEVTP